MPDDLLDFVTSCANDCVNGPVPMADCEACGESKPADEIEECTGGHTEGAFCLECRQLVKP